MGVSGLRANVTICRLPAVNEWVMDADRALQNQIERLTLAVDKINDLLPKLMEEQAAHRERLLLGAASIADHAQRLRKMEGRPCMVHAEMFQAQSARIDALDVARIQFDKRVCSLEQSGAGMSGKMTVVAVLAASALTAGLTVVGRLLVP